MYSNIEHLAQTILLSRFSEDSLMGLLYSAYFDASRPGNRKTNFPVLTIGGGVSPVKKWIRFESAWRAILEREHVCEFHATDFASSQGEYSSWRDDKDRRSKFVRDLCRVVAENVNKLFLVGSEIDAWNSVNSIYMLEETFYSPYAISGLGAILDLKKWAKRKNIDTLEVAFEEGDPGWGGLKQLCSKVKIEPIQLPKSKTCAFQVGDLLAWKYRIAATNSLKHLHEDQSRGTYNNLHKIIAELASLDSVLHVPARQLIHSEASLLRTCQKSNVPLRSSIVPRSVLPPSQRSGIIKP